MSERAGTSFGRVAAVFLVCIGLVSCLPAAAAAQAVTGTIVGTVVDSTGAVVAGAKVTITNTGTGLTRTVTSDNAGEYTAPSLPTGTYLVTARDGRVQDRGALRASSSASASASRSTSRSKSAT